MGTQKNPNQNKQNKKDIPFYKREGFKNTLFTLMALGCVRLVIHTGKKTVTYFTHKAENEQKHKQKLKEIKAQGEVQEKLNAQKADLKDRNDERKMERWKKFKEWADDRKKSNQKDNAKESDEETIEITLPPTVKQLHENSEIKNFVPSYGPSWLFENEITGFVGPTNKGKTAYLREVATKIAGGYVDDVIDPEWSLRDPVSTIYIDCEGVLEDFKERTQNNSELDTLSVISGETDAVNIKNQVELWAKVNREKKHGIIFLDNATIFNERNPGKKGRIFFEWYEKEKLNRKRDGGSLGLILVLHTKGKYNWRSRFDPHKHVRGDFNTVNLCRSFLYFGPCGLDESLWLLKEIKNKHRKGREKKTVSLYKSIDSEEQWFGYVREADEDDVVDEVATGTRGPKPQISDKQIEYAYHILLSGEKSLEQIADELNFSREGLRKRLVKKGWWPLHPKI